MVIEVSYIEQKYRAEATRVINDYIDNMVNDMESSWYEVVETGAALTSSEVELFRLTSKPNWFMEQSRGGKG